MASKFQFNLKFDNEGTEDFINVADTEVSRILNSIVTTSPMDNLDTGNPTTDILLDIMATRFCVNGGTPNLVIKSMLTFLAVDSTRTSVGYCFNCDKYVMGKANENICAYDTVGQSDSHRTFHIDIIETRIPSIEETCHDAIFRLKSEINAYEEGLTCSREFLNKIVDVAVTAHNNSDGADCSQHHACGTNPGDHNCSCIRN